MTSQTTATAGNIVSALKNSTAMSIVETIARKLVASGTGNQLTNPEGDLEWTDKEGNRVFGDKKAGYVPAFASELEVCATLGVLDILRPIMEGNFEIVERDTKGKESATGKTDWIIFDSELSGCRLDWYRNAFRKLAGVHREGEGPKQWADVFSGSKGKSKGRKAAITEGGSKLTFGNLKDKKDDK